MKQLSLILASLSLLVCLIVPILFFRGTMGVGTYHTVFLVASVGWFVFATVYSAGDKEGEDTVVPD